MVGFVCVTFCYWIAMYVKIRKVSPSGFLGSDDFNSFNSTSISKKKNVDKKNRYQN